MHTNFSLLSVGFATNNATGDNSVVGKEEPATLPRVSQIVLVSRYSPWCTIVKKETGVTIGDICSAIFKEYVPHVLVHTRTPFTINDVTIATPNTT